MVGYILSLDIGMNSIGWALLNALEKPDGSIKPISIERTGVRVFPDVVEGRGINQVSKNRARGIARTSRRSRARKKMRREKLRHLLERFGLLPVDREEQLKILTCDREYNPYELRRRGLDEELTPFQMGRVLFHLNQRRGFKSNRRVQFEKLLKTPEVAAMISVEEESGGSGREQSEYLGRIKYLQEQIDSNGMRTIGEFLCSQPKKRGTFIGNRNMYHDEFLQLWNVQKIHFPDRYSDDKRAAVESTIFFQRPSRSQKNLIGPCQFESKKKHSARPRLEFQEFRMLELVNDLGVIHPITREVRKLSATEREKIIARLSGQKTLSWGAARKVLGLQSNECFNLEEEGRSRLVGNVTKYEICKILKKAAVVVEPDRLPELVEDLLSIQRKDVLYRRLMGYWHFPRGTAFEIAIMELEYGFGRLSLCALKKLLPLMRDGVCYHDACQAVGYQRTDLQKDTDNLLLPVPPKLRNPVINKALHEARRVVNAIVKKYGKPSVIKIEMAKDLKLSKKQKEFQQRMDRKTQNLRIEAKEKAAEVGVSLVTGKDILKYRLWKETGGFCPYTGESIGLHRLFSDEVEVEHIIPYTLSVDDSYINKTICIAEENRRKKRNMTPYEAYSGDSDRYEQILTRIRSEDMKNMPEPKKRRFEIEKVNTEDFVDRQLSDTRYICREISSYFRLLGKPVQHSRGATTAMLRRLWGLNPILVDGLNRKNRSDHRSHAIDAVVIGILSPDLFHLLSQLSSNSDCCKGKFRLQVPTPWDYFFESIESSIHKIIVSHVPQLKLGGALHKDTPYGICWIGGKRCLVVRKRLDGITKTQVTRIVDSVVKRLVVSRLESCGNDIKKAFATPLFHVDGKTPIRRVRVKMQEFKPKGEALMLGVKNSGGKVYKYYGLGNNHHVEVLRNKKTGKQVGEFVSMLEAARRARILKTPMCVREHGEEWEYVDVLHVNDLVELKEPTLEFTPAICRVQKLDASNRRITFRYHASGSTQNDSYELTKPIAKIDFKRIEVDVLGLV